MNILINYQGRAGAGAVCALEWGRGFKKIGCDVYAALSKDIANAEEWVALIGEDKIFWVKTYKDKDHFDFLISTLEFIFIGKKKLKRKFRNIKFNFTLRTLYSHWAYLVDCSVRHDKIVTLCHDPVNHSGEKKYIKKMYHKHICQSDDVFVLTKSFKPVVNKNYGIPMDRIHYVPHGRMQMYTNVKNDAYHIDFDRTKTNFVFFGRIEEYKGLHVLAEACQILRKKRNDFTVLVAGSGDFTPYKNEFEQLDCAKVINKFIPDEQVGCIFDGENIVTVVPYIDATQSGVIPLAYEYDSPVIASNTGGLFEQLDNGRIGLLFENNNADDLALKMEDIMDHPSIFEEQVKLMREYRESLNWDLIAQQLLDELYGTLHERNNE